ncbi:hypothetical protein NOV18_10050 [Pseudomonas asiatica]|uniref:Uncharacterized protein n=1 Tax=Pseudomonas asiatica TaxID=2219225 RepID=A0AAJ5IQA7_9PSED|nr:hypothetical protein [Pseudomonas asiatica]UUC20793.1 hypothetical protein NOV18_10050 [Pseudomonas asiatica]
MKTVRVGDLKKILDGQPDDTVVWLMVFDEDEPGELVYSSDIDRDRLDADLKSGYQTTDGDQNVLRLYVTLDLHPCS